MWSEWFLANTRLVVYFSFIINHTANANIISLVFPLSLFAYAIIEFPRPPKAYWKIMLAYTNVILVVKFIFQITVFCICACERYRLQPSCLDDAQVRAIRSICVLSLSLSLWSVPDVPLPTGLLRRSSLSVSLT